MAEWCGLPDEGQWAPVSGDPAQAPAPPPPVVAEPVPEGAIEVPEVDWDPCADFWDQFPDGQDQVFEVTLTPETILPPYSAIIPLSGIALAAGHLTVVDHQMMPPLVGISLHRGSAGEATYMPPQKISAIYTQSSVYNGNTAATQAGMQNDTHLETTETGTDWHSVASGGPWVQMDFGRPRAFDQIVVGCDFDYNLYAGWGPEYAEFCDVLGSNDGTNWTAIVNTGEFTQPIQTYETPGAEWRYVRIVGNDEVGFGYLALTEFYAMTDHDYIELTGVNRARGIIPAYLGQADHSGAMNEGQLGVTVHAGIRTLWMPAGMSNLELWGDAMYPDNFTHEDNGLQQWDDMSGNLRHIVRQTNYPRARRETSPINGLPGVRFNTNYDSQSLVWPQMWVPNSAETFKFLHNGLSQVYVAFSLEFGEAADQCGIFTTFAGSGQIGAQLYMQTGAETTAGPVGHITGQLGNSRWLENGGSPMQRTEAAGLEWRGDPNNSTGTSRLELFRNFTKTSIGGSGTAAVSSDNPQLNLTIGYANRGGNTGAFVGLIHEILFFNAHHTLAERQKVWGYLMHRWGMEDKLPADHPYRYFPPLAE